MPSPRQSSIIFRLFKYTKSYSGRLYFSITTSITNKILDLMPPLLVAWVIDTASGLPPKWMIGILGTKDPMTLAIALAVLSMIIFGLESLFQWAYQYGFMTLAQKVQHHVRLDTYRAMQEREMSFFENHRLGDTLTILNDDTNQLERFLNNGLNQLIQLAVIITFSVAILFYTSWQLALIGLFPFPIIIWGSFIYQRLISPKYKDVREAVSSLSSQIENNIAGMAVIKSFTAENFESERVKEVSENYMQKNIKAIHINALYVPVIRTAISVGFASVLLVGSYWILKGSHALTIGELVLFATLIQRVLWPLTTLGTVLDDFERAKASLKRIFNLLDTEAEIKDDVTPLHFDIAVRGEIEFKNVNFTYPLGLNVLQNLNVKINAGETIGIAGATGSGKTTLSKLLFRFYDVNNGEITIDGKAIQRLPQRELRSQIALVSQDVYLFYGTIYENIAYGTENVTLDQARHAAKLAKLDDFIMTLPKQYDTFVGEKGLKLSGGQRQRLSIARAILKNAPIMVFDEATSSVDTETEKAIQENLNHLTKGKTALIIAHRLSTIKKASRIFVLANGELAEEGSHDVLLNKGGIYADLWKTQIGENE